jgi:hypothetical protein
MDPPGLIYHCGHISIYALFSSRDYCDTLNSCGQPWSSQILTLERLDFGCHSTRLQEADIVLA